MFYLFPLHTEYYELEDGEGVGGRFFLWLC
jgi:hypothetical protein